MAQRKCGTCRYFEEGGVASSGWCRHPLRQDLQFMVLVRKNELGCRGAWGEDLWESKDEATEGRGPAPAGVPDRPAAVRTPLPASEARSIRSSSVADVEHHTDKIAAIGIAKDSVTEIRPSFGHHASINNPLTRPIHPPVESQSHPAPATETGSPKGTVDNVRSGSPDTFGSESNRETVRQSSQERANFGYQPAVTGDSRPEPLAESRQRAPEWKTSDRSSHGGPSSGPNARLQSGAKMSGIRSVPQLPEPPDGRVAIRDRDDLAETSTNYAVNDAPKRSGTTEQFAVAEESSKTSGSPDEQSARPDQAAFPPRGGNPLGDQAPLHAPASAEGSFERSNFGASPGREEPAESQSGALPPAATRQEIAAKRANQIPVIPCCCGTCLDFRATEGGKSGMCMNRLAFDQPSMVAADDIACASSIGNWWVPNNDWWEQKIDTTHHGRPTPNFDALIKDLLERYPKAKREAR